MVKVTDKNYYMDETLRQNLDILKKAVKNHWDGFIMIDGIEGSAKTTLASSVCYYLDNNYGIDNVVFTQDEFFKAVDNAKPGTAIHWDEFIFGGLSTEALNKVQNALIKKITTIRKKRLYIVLVMPWFFMMRPYFAIGRSRCLIHTYTPDGISRGRFKFYSFIKKQKLYLAGKKEYQYFIKPDFLGRFTDTFGMFWDEAEYDERKEKAIKMLTDSEVSNKEKKLKIVERQRNRLIRYLREHHVTSYGELAKIVQKPKSTISSWYSAITDPITNIS
jgi:DNA-binding transcriptional regulator YiaG